MSNSKQVLISTISYNTMHNTYYMVIKDGLKEYAISRTEKQLQADLDSINIPIQMHHAVKNCKAEVTLNYHKEGEQVLDREGIEVTNEDGTPQKYRKDGARIDGFVVIEPSQTLLIAQLTVATQVTAAPAAEVTESFAPEAKIEETV